MIQAVVRDGTIELLDALPDDWCDGQRVFIDRPLDVTDEPETPQQMEEWYQDWCASASAIDPRDHERLMQAIDEHRREQKELMSQMEPTWPSF